MYFSNLHLKMEIEMYVDEFYFKMVFRACGTHFHILCRSLSSKTPLGYCFRAPSENAKTNTLLRLKTLYCKLLNLHCNHVKKGFTNIFYSPFEQLLSWKNCCRIAWKKAPCIISPRDFFLQLFQQLFYKPQHSIFVIIQDTS